MRGYHVVAACKLAQASQVLSTPTPPQSKAPPHTQAPQHCCSSFTTPSTARCAYATATFTSRRQARNKLLNATAPVYQPSPPQQVYISPQKSAHTFHTKCEIGRKTRVPSGSKPSPGTFTHQNPARRLQPKACKPLQRRGLQAQKAPKSGPKGGWFFEDLKPSPPQDV